MLVSKILNIIILQFILFSSTYCSTLITKKNKVKEVEFDYEIISKNYFLPGNEKPFPLTVQKGNNLHNSTSKDGKFLFYSSNTKGNYDIYIRDLKSSSALPLTFHPAAESKPTISPDGKHLIYVSEEDDSKGDLILCEVNPEKIFKDHLLGKEIVLSNKINLTNPNGKDIYYDTDPSFSPDGLKVVFSSNRLTPEVQNIVVMDIEDPSNIYRISDSGGSSPTFSMDGKYITYVSFKYHINGDIVVINIESGEEKFLTNDNFPDFTPSFGSTSNNIYFTSIREDSNKDGLIDEKDVSRIIKKFQDSSKEYILTPSDYSSFDSRYSNFNGGSIIYSASVFNSINIYFFPSSGLIPKKESPQDQLKMIDEYLNSDKESIAQIALDSMALYFENHPLFQIYQTKTEILKLQFLSNKRKKDELRNEFNLIFDDKSEEPRSLYKKILAYNLKGKLYDKTYHKEIEILNKIFEKTGDGDIIYPAFLEAYAESKLSGKNISDAISIYNKILNLFPDYYNIIFIKLRMGDIVYTPTSVKIPEVYMNLLDEPIPLEDKIQALIDIENDIKFSKNPTEKLKYCDNLISENNLIERSNELYRLVTFIKAESLSESKNFIESNNLLDKITDPVPIINPICAFTAGCKQKLPCENDRVCLKVHLLKALNNENLGNYNVFFDELKIYLQGYNPELKVIVDKSEIEKNFRYFELKAKEYENMGMLRESALNFFYNTENMFLLKEKNLYVNSIYKNFGNYYYKKMVDYIMKYARQQAQDERESIINKINIIGNEDIDLIGNYNKIISYIPKNRISSIIVDNLKIDVSNEVVLGKPGSNDDALKLIEQHFKLSRPRSRPVLYLASLFGYAYYQIQKSIDMDDYYRKKGNLTPNKKDKILENLKIAELELKWIIFADQEFIDAYLLLGYLYQYIDLSKAQNIGEATEGEEFVEIYDIYFPGNNLEKNIDLYKQIITFIGDTPNKKYLSDIHLNLGNTYLYLNNFSKANENYKLVSEYSKEIINEVQFSDPKQKALFHYNFTKSLLSNNQFLNADFELNKLIEFYSGNLNFSYDNNQINQKLVLIHTLKGYANSELKNYGEAIENYLKALAINSNYIPVLSLYNSLAYNYIMKRDFQEAKKYIDLAKREYKEESVLLNLFDNLDIWTFLLPERLRTLGDGKISKSLPNSLQFLWTTGNELLLASLNFDENRVAEIIQERNLFINKYNLYKYNIDSNILNYDKSLLANIYYENKNFNLSSEIYKELYEKDKNWNYLLNQSYIILKQDEIDLENKINNIIYFLDKLKKYKSNFINKCYSIRSNNKTEYCEIEFYKEHKEYEIIEGNIYHTLYSIYQKDENLLLSSYYYSLYFDLYNSINKSEIKFSQNDPYGKIDRIKLLLNQLVSIPEPQFEDKSRELEFYIKEFQLREEEFLLSIIKIKYYLKSKNYSKVKSIYDTHSELFLQMVYSPIINENDLLEFIQLEIEYNYFNNTLFNIPFLEEKKINIRTIRTFLKYTFEFRVNDTKRNYLLVKESYDKFTKKIISSRNNFNNKGIPISYTDILKNYENFISLLNQFINTNERFSYLKLQKSYRTFPKNSIIISKIDNYYLFFGNNNKIIFKILHNHTNSKEELDSFIPGDIENYIIYTDINEIDNSILQFLESTDKSLFFSNHDLEKQLNSNFSNYFERYKIEDLNNLYDKFNIEVNFKNKNFSDLFQTSSKSFTLKYMIENDFFVPSISLNTFPKESNLIGIALRMSNFNDIIYSFNGYNIRFGSKKIIEVNSKEVILSALKYEHTENYKKAIYLLKSIDQNSIDTKERLHIDLILTRLYAKEFKNNSYEEIFNNLISKYKSKEDIIKIRKEEIRYCYFLKYNNCYNKVKLISNLLNDSSMDVSIRIKFLNSINYYENYTNHLYQSIYKNHEEYNLQEQTEDEFLFLTNNIKFFINNYHFDEALYFLNKLSMMQLDKEEIEILSSLREEIFLISKLIGVTIDLKISPKENIYFNIINRNYDHIIKEDYNKSSLESFKNNIYKSYLSLEIGENFSISTLFNKKLVLSHSIYSMLNLKDKLILFYIFSKSFSNQKDNEITEMVFQLLHPDNGIDSKISANLLLIYAENAINRNDTKISNLVIDYFNLKYQNHLLDDYINKKYDSLKTKNLFLSSNIFKNSTSNEYLILFDKIKYNPKNSYVYLNTFIKLKNEESYSSYHKRELNDLIILIQKLSLHLDSTSLFYDFSIYKDKLSIFNERFFPNGVKFKDLPTIQQISSELIQKTPSNQSIVSLFPFGNDIIKIKIAESKITGKVISNENLKLRNDTILYYNSITNSGSSPILREFLETKLRKILLLEKKKRTYLYLSSHILKVPIEFKEEDNFFIIHSPDLLVSNEAQKYNSLFENGFNTNIYQSNEQNRALINKLEKIELYKNDLQSKTKIIYLSQKIYLKDKKTIFLDNLEFSKSNFPKIENGILLIANSDLFNTSMNKEDLVSIIQSIESSQKGQILYSFTPQYNETDPLLFYKELLNNYDYPVNIKSRFVNSIKLFKYLEKKEIKYIGYRLSTNCFLVD